MGGVAVLHGLRLFLLRCNKQAGQRSIASRVLSETQSRACQWEEEHEDVAKKMQKRETLFSIDLQTWAQRTDEKEVETKAESYYSNVETAPL